MEIRMETLYRRIVKDGEEIFEPVETEFRDRLPDGIWVIQTKPGSRGITSAAYMVGNIKKPADLVVHASIQSMGDEISRYLTSLNDEKSEEHQEAQDILGGFLRGRVEFYNISAHDLAMLILRQVAIKCDIDLQTRTRMIW
jgi:hypothetical protein